MTEDFLDILGVPYTHAKTTNGGDIYFTRHGTQVADVLKIENWYEDEWFASHGERLVGTSSVYRVPTKEVGGRRLQLVVKHNRVGEDVPVDTHTLEQFVNAEFNSPWEEFALVTELRESGTTTRKIGAQKPLAIYIPPEKLQLWQTGRSRSKINKIRRRHPGIDLDILRQYKLVYQWIEGLDIVQAFEELGVHGAELEEQLRPITTKVTRDMEAQGFVMADMKAVHIIIREEQLQELRQMQANGCLDGKDFLHAQIAQGRYSVIDYELLLRTPRREAEVKHSRRHSYLDDQRDRFIAAPMPRHLRAVEIMGVPYVHGHVESTGGMLWVVGRNPRLFDYFLPERWRKTPHQRSSDRHEVYHTSTKDNIHVVWKISRVGELPREEEEGARTARVRERGFNSPFEEFSMAAELEARGIPCVYMRAIYMTGSPRGEPVTDPRRYDTHRMLTGLDGLPILREGRNYISIRGYYNGSDKWVAEHEGLLYQPFDLGRAREKGILTQEICERLLERTRARLSDVGYNDALVEAGDIIISVAPDGGVVTDSEGLPETRICDFELLYRA